MRGLAWHPEEERPVDRVTAAGVSATSCPLGLLLWKALNSLESAAYTALKKELLKRFMKRYKSESEPVARAIVDQAVREYFSRDCRTCEGKKEVCYDSRYVTCPECSGTGTHRYSDTERAKTMQISYARVKHSAFKIQWVIETLATEDRAFGHLMADKLGRP